MKVEIIPIGNSKGIRIPKALLEQCGINGSVDIAVEGKKLVIRPLKKKPREGWKEAFAKYGPAPIDEETKAWLDMPNSFDDTEWTW